VVLLSGTFRRPADAEEGFHGAPFVHCFVSIGDVLQVGGIVKDAAGVDAALEDVG
jgi:hypothetical protein